MKMRPTLIILHILLLAFVVALSFSPARWQSTLAASNPATSSDIASQIIAREKAAVEAWQRKDKAFFANLLADDATYYSPHGPYLETDPKQNFLPKFEQYAESMKILDFQMHNPHVQVYGDVAILTYGASMAGSFNGQPMQHTSKVTAVYAKQGSTWRMVHGHESLNPGMR